MKKTKKQALVIKWFKRIYRYIAYKLKRKWKGMRIPMVKGVFPKINAEQFLKTRPMCNTSHDISFQMETFEPDYEKIDKLKKISDMNICSCDCHIDGTDIIHCFSCCGLCYKKYITSNYELDVERYQRLCKNYGILPYKRGKDSRITPRPSLRDV